MISLDPKILYAKVTPPENINVIVDNSRMKVNETTLTRMEKEWQRLIIESKFNKRPLWNGPIYRFKSLEQLNNKLTIRLGKTNYRETVCSNKLNTEWATIYGRDYLANNVGLLAIIETEDNKIVLGHRQYEDNILSLISGVLSIDSKIIEDGYGLNKAIEKEMEEELGINTEDIEKMRLIGIVEGLELFVDFVFFVKLSIN
jgi:hypothetical protein